MTPNRQLRILALAIIVCTATLACSDDPTQPRAYGGPPPPNFSLPESTLAVLANAIHQRNMENCDLCLADTLLEGREFHATFDPADLTDFITGGGVPPADWNGAAESAFLPHFLVLNTTAFYEVRFTLDTDRGGIIDVGGPKQKHIYNLHYRVWAGSTPVVAGAVGMTFERLGVHSDFKITYWEDRRDTTEITTWGLARLRSL